MTFFEKSLILYSEVDLLSLHYKYMGIMQKQAHICNQFVCVLFLKDKLHPSRAQKKTFYDKGMGN